MKQNTKEMNVKKREYYQRVNDKVRLVKLHTTEELIVKELVNIKRIKTPNQKLYL